jgi:hypothetical protein
MPGFNPVMELVKLPSPEPLEVLLSEVVGDWLVLQQTPREVTVAPPSEVTSPLEVAELAVIPVTASIETTGAVFIASFLQLNKVNKSITVRSTRKIGELFFIAILNLVNYVIKIEL